MTQDQVQQIKNNPKYQELVSKRSSFAWMLSIIMLVVYYTFIMIIAFKPEVLGTKMSDGVMTIGIPVGIVIIIIAFALTGMYVRRANSEFDELARQVKEEIK